MIPPTPKVRYQVLIVEDEEPIRETISVLAEMLCPNAEVYFAATVAEASAFLDSAQVDLVISDYDLKAGGKGHEVLQKALTVCPTAVRAYMSARIKLPEEYVNLAHATFIKPWDAHSFAAFVNGGFVEKRPAA